MKIHSVKIKNFRGYKDEQEITFSSLTALIGKNDVGKSTILEALDIFFDNRKIENTDKCILSGEKEYPTISVEFKNYPEILTIDSSVETNLRDENLLNENGFLEIRKTYQSPKTIRVEIKSHYPTSESLLGLLQLKINELKKRAENIGIPKENYNASISSSIRKSIRDFIGEVDEKENIYLNIDEDGLKSIWSKLKSIMPVYALFQADRKNEDKDAEIQDPLKSAAQRALKQKEDELNAIRDFVQNEVAEIAGLTIEKLRE